MGQARYISGNKPPMKGAWNRKSVLKARDKGMEESEDTPERRKRINKRQAAEAEFHQHKPVAGLAGYFTPRAQTPCKTYSKEEIAALNTENNVTETLSTEGLFTEDEIRHMLRLCLKRGCWMDGKMKEHEIGKMTDDHIINTMLYIKRSKMHATIYKKALRLFAEEVERRGIYAQ